VNFHNQQHNYYRGVDPPLFQVTPEPDARPCGRADFFYRTGIMNTKYIPKPSEGDTLIVNEPFGRSVNPDVMCS